jgi:hypothetical protein
MGKTRKKKRTKTRRKKRRERRMLLLFRLPRQVLPQWRFSDKDGQ